MAVRLEKFDIQSNSARKIQLKIINQLVELGAQNTEIATENVHITLNTMQKRQKL